MKRILTAKISKKNTLQDFEENIYSKNSKYKIFLFIVFFLSFLCIKGANIKMSLISVEWYENAGVKVLKIKETDEIWPSMKHVRDGLGVKSISDLVLK